MKIRNDLLSFARLRSALVVAAIAGLGLLGATNAVCAQAAPGVTFTSLYSFSESDGYSPVDSLAVGYDGDLYGTTWSGGSSDCGTVFKITPGGLLDTLYNFTGIDGSNPQVLVRDAAGDFYGTTNLGGAEGDGTIFQITTSGALTNVYNFSGEDGVQPTTLGGLFLSSDGNLYGTTAYGGASEDGTVYKIASSGFLTSLYSFTGVDGNGDNVDGVQPNAGVIQARDGNFYGTARYGGAAGNGAIFKITPDGVFTTVYSFSGSDGAAPSSALVQGSDENFYGTTYYGGSSGAGTVFKITPSGTLTVLHSFSEMSDGENSDGANPWGDVIQGSDGNFYGTTSLGGDSGSGTLFRITPSGAFTTLYSFSGADGASPGAGLVQTSDGSFFGTTMYGGASGDGTIFRLAVSGVAPPVQPNTSLSYPAGVNFFSVPYSYSGSTLDTLFGYSGVTLYDWDEVPYAYDKLTDTSDDSLNIGAGYWARFPSAITVSAGALADTTKNFTISLQAGWNQIGDPFLTTVPVSSLLFDGGKETFAQATTGANPLIGASVWSYPSGSASYQAATELDPGAADWIFAYQATDMQVPHP